MLIVSSLGLMFLSRLLRSLRFSGLVQYLGISQRGTLLGVHVIRAIVFWVYIGLPLILGNYNLEKPTYLETWATIALFKCSWNPIISVLVGLTARSPDH